jgi:hypothetical protein
MENQIQHDDASMLPVTLGFAIPFPAPATVVDTLKERMSARGIQAERVISLHIKYLHCTDLPGVLDALDAALQSDTSGHCPSVRARQVTMLPRNARVQIEAVVGW